MSAVEELKQELNEDQLESLALRHAAELDALRDENERLRQELATARDKALEDAARVCDEPPYCATAIRALKGKP